MTGIPDKIVLPISTKISLNARFILHTWIYSEFLYYSANLRDCNFRPMSLRLFPESTAMIEYVPNLVWLHLLGFNAVIDCICTRDVKMVSRKPVSNQ